jgi:hypothetical protein
MVLASIIVTLLLLSDTYPPVNAAPAAAERSPRAAERQAPASATAAHLPPEPAPELARERAAEPAAPAQEPGQGPAVPATDQGSASRQAVLKSRRALETVDARELLRQGALPPAGGAK